MPQPQPPLDSNGHVIPHDCPGLNGSDLIIRKVSEHVIKGGRISSVLYKKSSKDREPYPGMSIEIEKLITQDNIDPRVYLTTPKWFGSVCFQTADLRELGFMVGPQPILAPPPPMPYHGQVWGDFTGSQVKSLQRKAEWYVSVKGCDLRA